MLQYIYFLIRYREKKWNQSLSIKYYFWCSYERAAAWDLAPSAACGARFTVIEQEGGDAASLVSEPYLVKWTRAERRHEERKHHPVYNRLCVTCGELFILQCRSILISKNATISACANTHRVWFTLCSHHEESGIKPLLVCLNRSFYSWSCVFSC